MGNNLSIGVYKITNLVNGKVYIGSSVNIKSRKWKHFYSLSHNKHQNQHLQRAYNKYGKENFSFEILKHIDFIENYVNAGYSTETTINLLSAMVTELD